MSLTRRTRKPLASLFGAAQPMLRGAREVQFHEDYTDYAFPVLGQGTISFGLTGPVVTSITFHPVRVAAYAAWLAALGWVVARTLGPGWLRRDV